MVNWTDVIFGSFATAWGYVIGNAETLKSVGFFFLIAYALFKLFTAVKNWLFPWVE